MRLILKDILQEINTIRVEVNKIYSTVSLSLNTTIMGNEQGATFLSLNFIELI